MKPSFESAKHQAILAQRLQDQEAARSGKIVDGVGGKAARILSNELTATERGERRGRAMAAHPEAFQAIKGKQAGKWKKYFVFEEHPDYMG